VLTKSTGNTQTVALCHSNITTALTTSDLVRVGFGGSLGAPCTFVAHVLEFSGVKPTSPVSAAVGTTGSSVSASSGAINLSAASLVVGAIAWKDNAGVAGASAPWVNFFDLPSGNLELVTQYVVTSSTPQSATSTDDNAHQWAAAVVGYLPGP